RRRRHAPKTRRRPPGTALPSRRTSSSNSRFSYRVSSRWMCASCVGYRQRIVTVQVTPSTGSACPPENLTGALTWQEVVADWVLHSLSPGQPPATVVQGPEGAGGKGNVPWGQTGGLVRHLMTHDPFGPVQVPVPRPVQQPTGLPLPRQKELGVQVPVPAPVQH